MPLLQVQNVTLRFGGLTALDRFCFALDQGELCALIGPNGAGKTTAFNAVTGVYTPTQGNITLCGQRIEGKPLAAINAAGLARTFQNIRLFQNLRVIDNVRVALRGLSAHGLASTFTRGPLFFRHRAQEREQAMELLETLNLADKAKRIARTLPYGDQRRLEVARALATRPRILMLDEPAAGMNPREKIELMELIRFIRDKFGVGIWVIEHDMKLVMSLCERITVLDHGETIAVGSPQQIQSDPRVISAYLGDGD